MFKSRPASIEQRSGMRRATPVGGVRGDVISEAIDARLETLRGRLIAFIGGPTVARVLPTNSAGVAWLDQQYFRSTALLRNVGPDGCPAQVGDVRLTTIQWHVGALCVLEQDFPVPGVAGYDSQGYPGGPAIVNVLAYDGGSVLTWYNTDYATGSVSEVKDRLSWLGFERRARQLNRAVASMTAQASPVAGSGVLLS